MTESDFHTLQARVFALQVAVQALIELQPDPAKAHSFINKLLENVGDTIGHDFGGRSLSEACPDVIASLTRPLSE